MFIEMLPMISMCIQLIYKNSPSGVLFNLPLNLQLFVTTEVSETSCFYMPLHLGVDVSADSIIKTNAEFLDAREAAIQLKAFSLSVCEKSEVCNCTSTQKYTFFFIVQLKFQGGQCINGEKIETWPHRALKFNSCPKTGDLNKLNSQHSTHTSFPYSLQKDQFQQKKALKDVICCLLIE